MHPRYFHYCIFFAGSLICVAALGKLASSMGSAHVLQYPDPIFQIPFRQMFWLVGTVELAIAVVCLFGRRIALQACLVAWLATAFAAYRLGLLWVGYEKPCSCLGNLTDALHIPAQTADTAMKIILAYLLICSYATLLWIWRQGKAASHTTCVI
ncbi:MAG: hypothetical protein P4N60_06820 [Verrucomicrobiae bacterium]|nr:hypothetical protein [Verrucomicrobiae bacterium]